MPSLSATPWPATTATDPWPSVFKPLRGYQVPIVGQINVPVLKDFLHFSSLSVFIPAARYAASVLFDTPNF